MALTTITSRAAAALVAAVAGFASYQHIYRVAINAGEHRSVSAVLPLAIDGLILVATLAMLDDKRNRRTPRMSARIALGFGVLATLAANIASAQPTVTARMVAAVPAVSFMLAVEVLARTGKPLPATATQDATTQDAAAQRTATPETASPEAVTQRAARHDAATDRPADEGANLQPTPAYTPDIRPRPARARASAPVTPAGSVTPAASSSTAQRVAEAATALPDGTVAQIAARAGVSTTTARRHLAAASMPGTTLTSPAAVPVPVPVPATNGHPVRVAP